MKKVTFITSLVVGCLFSLPSFGQEVQAKAKGCKNVSGKAVWNLIATPNDILGRVLGPTTGTLKGAVTAYLTSLSPQENGSFIATSRETWSTGGKDTIVFDGNATFTPVAGQAVGTVTDSLTLTALSGTGKYAGVTGTIKVVGIGYALFGPEAGIGKTYFDVSYSGEICTQ